MLSITARNVNDAYREALWKMRILGKESDSRNGKVRRIPGPVATTYRHPTERMLFDPHRDANPFFHIFEGVWMLAGRNDVAFVGQFNSNIGQFSDTGTTFEGAYGHRWRKHFADDQLVWVIEHLRKNPTSRRCVLQMYDPVLDHPNTDHGGNDIPCNTAIYFGIGSGSLNMTVTCRSNDMIWGCYGANAVHMSVLQEFVANSLGVRVGWYCQFSNDFHIYERHFPLLDVVPDDTHHYPQSHVPMTEPHCWVGDLNELTDWCDSPREATANPFVAMLNTMLKAWYSYKRKDKEQALYWAKLIQDVAVKVACTEWLNRRKWE